VQKERERDIQSCIFCIGQELHIPGFPCGVFVPRLITLCVMNILACFNSTLLYTYLAAMDYQCLVKTHDFFAIPIRDR